MFPFGTPQVGCSTIRPTPLRRGYCPHCEEPVSSTLCSRCRGARRCWSAFPEDARRTPSSVQRAGDSNGDEPSSKPARHARRLITLLGTLC